VGGNVGGKTEQSDRIKVSTVTGLQALRADDHGKKVSLGDSMTGEVRAGRDGISVHVSWRYRINGKTREIAIGTWRAKDGMSLKALRDERDQLAADLQNGVDPIERKRADRLRVQADQVQAQADERARLARIAEDERQRIEAAAIADRRMTVRALFEQWQRTDLTARIATDGTRTGRKDGGAWVKASFERRLFPVLGEVAVEDVRKRDLIAILDACKVEGVRRTASLLLTDMRQMFSFAVVREIIPHNPLEGAKRATLVGKEVERDRVLSDDEIRALRQAVPTAGLGPRSEAALWLILATACRIGEAMRATWEHVDLEAHTWYLPDTKNERDHTIHLSTFALRQFKTLHALREERGGGVLPWVFPNAVGRVNKKAPDVLPDTKGRIAGPVDVKTFGKQLADRQREPERRMSGRSKSTNSLVLEGGRWTAHDLRRTAATIMARVGVSTDVIDECLNHKLQSKVARIYIQDRRLAEQARAFDKLGAHLEAIMPG
jgi:integrase